MDTLRELFEHELKDIYYAENRLVEALGELAGESSQPQLRQAFEEHRAQTQEHVKRLEAVFSSFGSTPEKEVCPGIEGLIKEKKMFSEEQPTPQLLDLFNIGAGTKSERYEISAYEGLISMAQSLGLQDAMRQLDANRKEEEQALQKLKTLAQQFQMQDGQKESASTTAQSTVGTRQH